MFTYVGVAGLEAAGGRVEDMKISKDHCMDVKYTPTGTFKHRKTTITRLRTVGTEPLTFSSQGPVPNSGP